MIRKKSGLGVLKDNHGSLIIFVSFFFLALLIMLMAFIDASKKESSKASVRSLAMLWGDSVLGEYDRHLQERYNLFGYYGSNRMVSDRIDYYAEYTCSGLPFMNYDGCSAELYEYSLANTDVIKEQMTDVGKLITAEKLGVKPGGQKGKENNHEEPASYGTSDSSILFSNLPSAGSSGSVSVSSLAKSIENMKSIADVVRGIGAESMMNTYINKYFKEEGDSKNLGKTYLNYELEYIICGKNSDLKNHNSIKLKIIAMREVVNLIYIQKNPKMQAELAAAAAMLTPGPESVVTQKLLMASWALAESVNDYNLLLNGRKVPLMKTSSSWAVDLDSIIQNTSDSYIDTGSNEGNDYHDYLNLMLNLTDSRIKLLRSMDLIQINMRHNYYSDFLLRDYYAGLRIKIGINGDEIVQAREY